MKTNTMILAAMIPIAAFTLLTAQPEFTAGLIVAILAFVAVWLLSLVLRDASIVDIFWGASFVLMAWFYLLTVPDHRSDAGWLVAVLVTVWGLRLTTHIAVRNSGKGEDFRYVAFREDAGSNFWWISFFKVFLLQAVLLWIISSPLLLVHRSSDDFTPGILAMVGLALWIIGFGFEAVADWQLSRFKSDPANRGAVMSSGLWSLSRHPNYFGEAVLWWGIGLISFSSGGGWLSFVGPVVISYLLLKVSGVTLLEDALVERRAGYADYIASTPAFLPLGRRRRPRNRKK